MSVNKYRPHIWVIPEDDADRQLVNGFLLHPDVDVRAVGISPPAGGWLHVLSVFEKEYAQYLRNHSTGHVVMLVDFDENGEKRRSKCEERIPEDLKSRAFLIGTSDTPEDLKKEMRMTFEEIGRALAEDCGRSDFGHWAHPHLVHNLAELQRMASIVRPIIFPGA